MTPHGISGRGGWRRKTPDRHAVHAAHVYHEQPRCPESWWASGLTREQFTAKVAERKSVMKARGITPEPFKFVE